MLDSLNDHVLSFFRPKNKSIFGVHDPIGLRYLFQLRVSLSPLRSHKSRHNFIDTPSDICHCNRGVEDTSHFLFLCPFYVPQRATLETSVNEIPLKNNLNYLENQSQLYLYGHDSINFVDNRKILISTLKYIKDTCRFLMCGWVGGWVCGWVGGWVGVGICYLLFFIYVFTILVLLCVCCIKLSLFYFSTLL